MGNKRAVLLFAGQGAQAVGMGKDLSAKFDEARELFAKADDQLGFSLTDVMFNGPASELTRTSNCQPALFVHGLACLAVLKKQVPDLEIAGVAGLSLGEFTAHTAAGTFDFSTGLDIVAKRGRFMEEATDATEGSMAAMIGGEEKDVIAMAEACEIDVANYNAPGQIVVSGTKAGIAKAIEDAENYGVRIPKELEVAGAYHSRLMMPAQQKLAKELAKLEINQPTIPVICNVDASKADSADAIRRTLEAQVSGSVRWHESIQTFLDDGETQFIELGPGRVLAGLMKRIYRKATMHSFSDVETLEKVVHDLEA